MLFELISARYGRRSMLITANQPLGEWNKVFPGPRHDARRHRSSRLSLDHHRDERRKLSQAHSTRAKTRSRTAALARHPKPSLIDAPRQSKPTKTLARNNLRGNHHLAATPNRHSDYRALLIQIVAVHISATRARNFKLVDLVAHELTPPDQVVENLHRYWRSPRSIGSLAPRRHHATGGKTPICVGCHTVVKASVLSRR